MSAVTGNNTMRVSMKRGSYTTSCETFAKGEVEDYTVNILPAKQEEPDKIITSEILVYLNPASEFISVNLSELEDVKTISCFDINGTLLTNMIVSSEIVQININDFPSGIYYIIATNEAGERINAKFIKQ